MATTEQDVQGLSSTFEEAVGTLEAQERARGDAEGLALKAKEKWETLRTLNQQLLTRVTSLHQERESLQTEVAQLREQLKHSSTATATATASDSGEVEMLRRKVRELEEDIQKLQSGGKQAKIDAGAKSAAPGPSAAVETTKATSGTDEAGNKKVNQYVIVKKLGAGSFGEVKLCRNERNGQDYAVKIFKKSVLKRRRTSPVASALQEVQKEVAIMKKIDHPNVVKLFEVIDDPEDDKLYIVLEFVEKGAVFPGGIVEAEPLSIDLCHRHFHDMILGLEYLHFQLKIAHRDIKPENLLVAADGTLKISDFGVSEMFKDEADALIKSTKGSIAFMAPEVLCGDKFPAWPVDIWAVGVTLYFFVFGKLPFTARSFTEMQTAVMAPLQFPHSVDPDLKDLLNRLLAKEYKQRITIEEIKDHPWVSRQAPAHDINKGMKEITVTKVEMEHAFSNVDRFVLYVKLKETMGKRLKEARAKLHLRKAAEDDEEDMME